MTEDLVPSSSLLQAGDGGRDEGGDSEVGIEREGRGEVLWLMIKNGDSEVTSEWMTTEEGSES